MFIRKQTVTNEYHCNIKHAQAIGKEVRTNPMAFDASKITTVDGKKLVECGLVMAITGTGSTKRFVPYSATAANGVGSDTPVCVLDVQLDVTDLDIITSGVTTSVLRTPYVYILTGTTKSAVTDTVKSNLNLITWMEF